MPICCCAQLSHSPAQVTELKQTLSDLSSPLLTTLLCAINNDRISALVNRIDTVITEDTSWCKHSVSMRQQECFAVKPGVDGNLDAVRKVYTDTLTEMYDSCQDLALEYGMPIKLHYTAARGYHLSIKLKAGASETSLPPEFIKIGRSRRVLSCTTELMMSFDQKVNESLQNIYSMTNLVID